MLFLVFSIILGVTVLPTSTRQVLLVVVGILVLIWVFFIINLINYLGKKIVVEDNLVYFKKKSWLGFGNWKIEKIIDFSQVAWVREKQKTHFLHTSKGAVPMVYYWLIFEMKNGSKQELLLNGWDFNGIKNLFFFLRGKFKEIKFDTRILRDSSEKLSGIDQYLGKS